MATSDKRARAYDFLSDFIDQAPEAAAKALLSAAFNIMTADDFVSMVEDEFEWEDEDEDEDGDPIEETGPEDGDLVDVED